MITAILITSVIILALTIASQEDMIFHFFQAWGEEKEKQGKWWAKPLITCPSCMPSVYSILGYVFAWVLNVEITWRTIVMYPVAVGAASVIVTFLWTAYLWVDAQIPYFRNIEKISHFDVKDRKDSYNRKQNRNGLSKHN
jgi:hypothetical protein